jgi:putative component of membrane protein insertase Oxa1/YidC/SpoIIIJ protein YidD
LEDGNIKKEYWQAQNNENEIQKAFSGLFLFTPSCSEYGILAIKGHGILKGGLMTIDRLTRCNGLSPLNYEFDKKLMLLKDDPNAHNHVSIVSAIK